MQRSLPFFLLAAVLAFAVHEIVSLDIWFHIKCGDLICDNLTLPETNTFSYIASDHPFHDFYWLFQVLVASLHRFFGTNGLIVLEASIFAVCFYLLWRIRERGKPAIIPAVCLLLALLASNERFILRPDMVSHLFLCLYLILLWRYRIFRGRGIWLLVPLQMLWVNMHGLWVLGLGLVWAYLIGELIMRKVRLPWEWGAHVLSRSEDRRLRAVGLTVTVATLVTPYPAEIMRYPLELFHALQGGQARGGPLAIAELKSPFEEAFLFPTQVVFYYKILLGLSALSFIVNFRRLNITYLLIYLGLLYVSVTARRNISYFSMAVAPVTAMNLQGFYDDHLKRFIAAKTNRTRCVGPILCILLIGVMVFLVYDVISDHYYIRDRNNKRFGLGISDLTQPEQAVDFIVKQDITGNIFNNPGVGHYFIWRCFPERMVFLDGRFDLPFAWLSHYYMPALWPEISEEYNINYVLLGHGRAPDLAGLLLMLYRDPGWVLVYYDNVAAVFVKNTPANSAVIERCAVRFNEDVRAPSLPVRRNLFGAPDLPLARFQIANFYAALGLAKRAEDVYRQCTEIYPGFVEAHGNLGSLYLRRRLFRAAITEFQKTVEIKPDFARGYRMLGDVWSAMGRSAAAVANYRKAIGIDPALAPAHWGLGLIYLQGGDPAGAEEEFKTVVRIDPANMMARRMLDYLRKAKR